MTSVELSIGGMTCASCAVRVEKKLNKLDNATAAVNFATEKARVEFGDDVTPVELVAAVEAAGYQARLPEPTTTADEPLDDDPAGALRQRLLICLVLSIPVIAMAMVPVLQFPNWQWLSLTLAAPVVVWGADLRRHARRARLVGLCTVLGQRGHAGDDAFVRADHRAHRRHRQHLPRSGRRGDDIHSGGALL